MIIVKRPNDVFPIGHKFTVKRGKKPPTEYTVTDHISSYNAAGDLVRFRYVTSHIFAGQLVFTHDVVHTTIKRAKA